MLSLVTRTPVGQCPVMAVFIFVSYIGQLEKQTKKLSINILKKHKKLPIKFNNHVCVQYYPSGIALGSVKDSVNFFRISNKASFDMQVQTNSSFYWQIFSLMNLNFSAVTWLRSQLLRRIHKRFKPTNQIYVVNADKKFNS